MGANRFQDRARETPWVSTYVPLPLDLINQQGAMKQKELDTSKDLLNSDMDPLSKIGNLSVTVKGYDRNGNIVDLQDNTFEDKKLQTISELAKEREQLVNDFQSGKIDDYQFKDLSRRHVKNAALSYNELAGIKNQFEAVSKNNELFAKDENFAIDPANAQALLNYNTDWINSGMKTGYTPPSIAKNYDILQGIKDMTFKDAGTGESKSLGDYIKTWSKEGVSKQRVEYAANQIFQNPNSDVYRTANNQFIHQINLNPKEYQTKESRDKLWQDMKINFVNTAIVEKAGEVYKEKLDEDANAIDRKQNPNMNFIFPGVEFYKPSEIKDLNGLQSKITTDTEAIVKKERDLEAKIKTGEYSDPNFISGQRESIAVAKENLRRLQAAKENALAGVTKTLSGSEKQDLQAFTTFLAKSKDENLQANELMAAIESDPRIKRGQDVAVKINKKVDENIKINAENSISPNLVYQGTKKELEYMDQLVDRNFKNTTTYDPSTGNVLTQEDLDKYKGAEFSGYTEEPIGDKGNKLGIKLIPVDPSEPIKQVYMDAPLNIQQYKFNQNPANTITVQTVAQQVQDIKDNVTLHTGKIILDGKTNYGEIVIPNRLPKTDVHHSDDANEILWKDPSGIFHKMTPSEIGETISLLKNIKK